MKMNAKNLALALVLSGFSGSIAMAANDEVQLQLDGQLTPATCALVVSQSVLNLGSIELKDDERTTVTIPTRVEVAADCGLGIGQQRYFRFAQTGNSKNEYTYKHAIDGKLKSKKIYPINSSNGQVELGGIYFNLNGKICSFSCGDVSVRKLNGGTKFSYLNKVPDLDTHDGIDVGDADSTGSLFTTKGSKINLHIGAVMRSKQEIMADPAYESGVFSEAQKFSVSMVITLNYI